MGNSISAKAPTVMNESVCPACFDLDYSKYSSFPERLFLAGASPPWARYKLTTSDEIQGAAARGCPICDRLLQRAIDFFWNSELVVEQGIQRRQSWTATSRPFKRALCIAQQPGSSLLLFRVILYDDIPDHSFIHALTVRDSAARIEFYREPS